MASLNECSSLTMGILHRHYYLVHNTFSIHFISKWMQWHRFKRASSSCWEKSICFSAGLHNLICSFLSCSFMNNSSTPIASVLCVSPYACVCCMRGGNALSEEPLPQLRDLQLCCRASLYRCRWKSRGLCMCVCVIWHWRYALALSKVLPLFSNATKSSRERHIQIMNTNTIALGRSHKQSQKTINNWSRNYILTYDNRNNQVGWRTKVVVGVKAKRV